jgi:hypothetical protein
MRRDPKHGKIAIENDTGFMNFREGNPRAECNKRRSDGVAVIYEPEPGYTGTDSISLERDLGLRRAEQAPLRDRCQITARMY